MKISWNRDLGNPTKPGTYVVKGIGEVYVKQDEINTANRLGGDPHVEISETTSQGGDVKNFILGQFLPG
jgi:hypothetical protein